ncbi:MAG TPA: single-stranded-DNA-specific exonuclease RecJ [Clostridia bacterium]|nr:single-stranded-DNA-specific exonuclease RecJ [Clostridia bacterium]
MLKKLWIYRDIDDKAAEKLSEEAGISRMLAKVFVSRGILDSEYVKSFLKPDISKLCDPFLMNGMEAAAERILQAVEKCEDILIYGDYDVDGVISTSILYRFLGSLGAKVQYYIPDRMEDGYGLTMPVAEKIKAFGISLMITVDCGITSVEEVKCLQEYGIQVIITDHHECTETLPNALAVINPHKPGCAYPFKELCGAGVALKLVQALCARSGCGGKFEEFLDLAAMATIADVVPLLGENRIIAGIGIKKMLTSANQGLNALIREAGFADKTLTSYNVAFGLAPRVNAAGRLGSAVRGVRLFTTDDRVLAEALAKELDEENKRRQDTENRILEEAIAYVGTKLDAVREKVLVVCGEGWHHGVIGIVASKLLDRYNRPCIVISIEDGIGKGSARSIKSFNIFKALNCCADLLERFGGHEMAAGITINEDKIAEFRDRLNTYADGVLTDTDMLPCIKLDTILERGDITQDSVCELESMAPFGEGNPNPVFGYRALNVGDVRMLSGGKHLKLRLADGSFSAEAVGFGLGEQIGCCPAGGTIDIAFTPEINKWNGSERLQLNIRDIRPCVYTDLDKYIVFSKSNDYNKYIDLREILALKEQNCLNTAEMIPERNEFEAVYRFIKSFSKTSQTNVEFPDLFAASAQISEKFKVKINFFKLKRVLEIFDELGLMTFETMDGKSAVVGFMGNKGKVDLDASRLYSELQRLSGAS